MLQGRGVQETSRKSAFQVSQLVGNEEDVSYEVIYRTRDVFTQKKMGSRQK